MQTIHISDIEAVSDFAGLLAKVRAGSEIIIEHGSKPIAIVRAPEPPALSLDERIALLPKNSLAVIDEDFIRDMEEVKAHYRNQPRTSLWD